MPITRPHLVNTLKRYAATAIEEHNEKWGRQLATICEGVAHELRVAFGGRSFTSPLQPRAYGSKPPRPEPVGETTTIQVRSDEDRWAEELAIWREIAASEAPLLAVDYKMMFRINALGKITSDFTMPIMAARREKRPLVVTAPNGETVTIDNL